MKLLRVALVIAVLAIPSIGYGQTLGTTTQIPEGTCGSGTSGTDTLCGNSADHQVATNPNNAGLQNLPRTYYLATDYTNATTAFTSVTNLAFPVNMNTSYHAICHIFWQTTVASNGPKYQWTGPNKSTLTLVTNLLSPTNFTAFQTATATTYSTTFANTTGAGASATNFMDVLEFTLINGANSGTVQLQSGPNAIPATLTIKAGSNCVVQ